MVWRGFMADRATQRTRDHRTRAPVHLQHRHALSGLALKPCRLQERVSLAWHCRLCGQTDMFSPAHGVAVCGFAPETLRAIARDIEERYPMKHFLKLLADPERSRPIARIQLSDRQERIDDPTLRAAYHVYTRTEQSRRGLPQTPPCSWCGLCAGCY